MTGEIGTKHALRTWLFNPFHYVAGGTALTVGLLIVVVASLSGSLSHSHFDGVLDFHMGESAPLWVYVAEGLIDWLILGVFLLAAGALLSRSHIRVIDVLGTQALARVPTLFISTIALLPGFASGIMDMANSPGTVPSPVAIAGLAGIMVMEIWMIALMYRAFAVSCNVSGAKGGVTFAVVLILAEAASKAAIIGLLKTMSI